MKTVFLGCLSWALLYSLLVWEMRSLKPVYRVFEGELRTRRRGVYVEKYNSIDEAQTKCNQLEECTGFFVEYVAPSIVVVQLYHKIKGPWLFTLHGFSYLKTKNGPLNEAFLTAMADQACGPDEDVFPDKPLMDALLKDCPLPPPPNNSIYVSLASYKDVLCKETIEGMFAFAQHPERLFVGVVEQNDHASQSCLPTHEFEFQNQTRIHSIPALPSQGTYHSTRTSRIVIRQRDVRLANRLPHEVYPRLGHEIDQAMGVHPQQQGHPHLVSPRRHGQDV